MMPGEVVCVCVLAHTYGFESAGDYGRANEATFPRLRAQAARAARRARALEKVNAFVSRHGLAFSPLLEFRTPPVEFFASGTRIFVLTKPRGSLRLVDLSRIPSGTFFREVHPGSEMTRQNHQK